MNQEKINNYIETIHNMFVEQGKYKCSECSGFGSDKNGEFEMKCESCGGSHVYVDTSKLIMDIITQLVKALENWDKKANMNGYLDCLKTFKTNYNVPAYSALVLNTREDHLAHAMILLFDLCGYSEIDVEYDPGFVEMNNNIHDSIRKIISLVSDYSNADVLFTVIIDLCEIFNIDIEKHIDARIDYTRVRNEVQNDR